MVSASQSMSGMSLGKFIARYGIVISFILLFVVLSLASPNFLSTNNLLNVLRQVSMNGVLAVGMTFVILTA
ncbi:ABC transporter permease, partial [Mesorhizobium sp. M7A.F.Ca.CA.001.09.1.1]